MGSFTTYNYVVVALKDGGTMTLREEDILLLKNIQYRDTSIIKLENSEINYEITDAEYDRLSALLIANNQSTSPTA